MSWLDRLVGRPQRTPASGTVAKERLKFVLEYDRAQISPAELDEIRDEIVELISRHVNVVRDDVEIKLEKGGRLVAEIPLDRAGRGDADGGLGKVLHDEDEEVEAEVEVEAEHDS